MKSNRHQECKSFKFSTWQMCWANIKRAIYGANRGKACQSEACHSDIEDICMTLVCGWAEQKSGEDENTNLLKWDILSQYQQGQSAESSSMWHMKNLRGTGERECHKKMGKWRNTWGKNMMWSHTGTREAWSKECSAPVPAFDSNFEPGTVAVFSL